MSEQAKPADAALRVKATESLMIEKGLVDPKARITKIMAFSVARSRPAKE